MIHDILLTVLADRRRDTPDYTQQTQIGRLWVSELGGCIRRATLRLAHLPTAPTEYTQLLRYENGTAFERSTVYLLQQKYGAQVKRQFVIETRDWAGRLDVLIDGDDVETPIIVEHKATGDRWWDYRGVLPEVNHVLQAAAYGVLYEQLHGVQPLVILYYRAWGHFAEFTIRREERSITVTGTLDDGSRSKVIDIDLIALMDQMVAARHNLPAVPPRLKDPDDGCLFRGQPSCPYYRYCWPADSLASGLDMEELL